MGGGGVTTTTERFVCCAVRHRIRPRATARFPPACVVCYRAAWVMAWCDASDVPLATPSSSSSRDRLRRTCTCHDALSSSENLNVQPPNI